APRADGTDRVARGADLQLLRHAFRQPDRARLGGVARAGADRAPGQRAEPAVRQAALLSQREATMNAHAAVMQQVAPQLAPSEIVIDCKLDKIFYGDFLAVRNSHVPIEKGKITGFIGPSGC